MPASPKSRSIPLLATLPVLMILLSGCPLAAKKVGEIVLEIGTEVLVQAGGDYLKSIFSPDDAKGDPTIVVSVTNSDGDGAGSTFSVTGFGEITTANVDVRSHNGGVHVVANGNGLAVTVDGGGRATVAINSSGKSTGAEPYSGAGDQAASIDGVLKWSSRSRSALSTALDQLHDCRNVDEATAALRTIARDRGRQAEALAGLDVSRLTGGRFVRDTLVDALRSSRKADLAFAAWGAAGNPECGYDRNYRDAKRYSRDADVAKKSFADAWAPIARQYDLRRYVGTDV